MGCEEFEIDLRDCELLGKGHNGTVYLLPDGRVIKIFKEIQCCEKEYLILKKVYGNRHFPKVYCCMGNYIIREYVGGECLRKYLKKHGLTREMAINLIKLLEEFRRLKFTKIDIRCKDIYVQEDRFLMVIDPKCSYTKERSFPRHLAKGLKKLGLLNEFMEVLKQEKPHLYDDWKLKIQNAGIM